MEFMGVQAPIYISVNPRSNQKLKTAWLILLKVVYSPHSFFLFIKIYFAGCLLFRLKAIRISDGFTVSKPLVDLKE